MHFERITLLLGAFRKLCMSQKNFSHWAIKNFPLDPKSPSNRNSPGSDNFSAKDGNFVYIGCNNTNVKASCTSLDVITFMLMIEWVSNILSHKNVLLVLRGGQDESTLNQNFGVCDQIFHSIILVRAKETSKMNLLIIVNYQ